MLLTIFYDGNCPLCNAEMQQLAALDKGQKLILENIHADDFDERFPHINPIEADKILHGQLADQQMLYGLDVTCMAWKLVGKHKWLQALRWPLVRPIADRAYLGFARYRHPISNLLSGQMFRKKDHQANTCLPCEKKHR